MQQKIIIGGLEKYQNYTVRLVATTKVGEGLKSRSIYCRTEEDGEKMIWQKCDISAIKS